MKKHKQNPKLLCAPAYTYSLMATTVNPHHAERIRRALLSAARRLKLHQIEAYYTKEATNHVAGEHEHSTYTCN
jgi:hypothetical protein